MRVIHTSDLHRISLWLIHCFFGTDIIINDGFGFDCDLYIKLCMYVFVQMYITIYMCVCVYFLIASKAT